MAVIIWEDEMRLCAAPVLVAITFPALASDYTFGPQGSPRYGSNDTVWDASCPEGTTVISGTCISNAGAIPLQSVGPEPGKNRWSCAWTQPMTAASVQALCAK